MTEYPRIHTCDSCRGLIVLHEGVWYHLIQFSDGHNARPK